MRISKDKYYKNIAKALLKGYFAGLEEGRKQKTKKGKTSSEERSRL